MSIATSRRIINTISIIGLGLSIALTIYFINLGVFKDINALRGLVGNSVILGPIIFMLLQILQVVIHMINILAGWITKVDLKNSLHLLSFYR